MLNAYDSEANQIRDATKAAMKLVSDFLAKEMYENMDSEYVRCMKCHTPETFLERDQITRIHFLRSTTAAPTDALPGHVQGRSTTSEENSGHGGIKCARLGGKCRDFEVQTLNSK
eukprot:219689_1